MGGKRLTDVQKSKAVRLYVGTDLGSVDIATIVGCDKATVSTLARAALSPEQYKALVRQKVSAGRLKALAIAGARPDPASIPTDHLWCSRCKTVKPEREFGHERASRTGRMRWCRACVAAADKLRRSTLRHKAKVYLTNARRRNLRCDFSADELISMFAGSVCRYCGSEIESGLGIDRLDNARGYEAGNMVACCSTCNAMKSTLSVEAFLAQCAAVTANAALALHRT